VAMREGSWLQGAGMGNERMGDQVSEEDRKMVCLMDVGQCRSLAGNKKGLDVPRTVRKIGKGLRLRGDAASDVLLVGVTAL